MSKVGTSAKPADKPIIASDIIIRNRALKNKKTCIIR